MAEVLVIPGLPSPADLSYELEIHRYLNYCEIMRSRRIPRRSVPYELDGWSHVERSLAAERGAIVLVAHFVHNGLAPKQVFYAKGQPLTHLSRLEHGYSKTRVGMRVLNPVRSGVEDRYLRRRALIRDGSATTALRQLARALQANQVVSLTAGAWEGSSIVEVPLFGRLYPLATGPFALAKLTGAPVLLLIATRASDGTVHVAITPPLSHGSDHIVDMGREAVERMAPYIRANPGQFRGWAYLHGLDEAT